MTPLERALADIRGRIDLARDIMKALPGNEVAINTVISDETRLLAAVEALSDGLKEVIDLPGHRTDEAWHTARDALTRAAAILAGRDGV